MFERGPLPLAPLAQADNPAYRVISKCHLVIKQPESEFHQPPIQRITHWVESSVREILDFRRLYLQYAVIAAATPLTPCPFPPSPQKTRCKRRERGDRSSKI